jgi:DNA-binding MarR family transcriptional regulator
MGIMQGTVVLDSRDIVQAQRATSAVLRVVLADHDITVDRWAVLDALATGAFPPERSRFLPGLAAALATGPVAVEGIVDNAQADGQVRIVSAPNGDPRAMRIELTAAGAAQHRILRSAIDRMAADLYMCIPERDLTTTHHVLAEVTRRADGWMQLWRTTRAAEPVR